MVGTDEISIYKGDGCRIMVNDLERRRPMWFGGQDPSEASMNEFYQMTGPVKEQKDTAGGHGYVDAISCLTLKVPHAVILFDTVHVLRNMGCSLGYGAKERVLSTYRQRPAFHQGREVHAAVARGESDNGWKSELDAVAQGQQGTEHGLSTVSVLKMEFGQFWDYNEKVGLVGSSRTGVRGSPR